MNAIRKALDRSRVVLDLDVTSKKRLFEHIGLLLENSNQLSRASVFEALFAREKLGSTGLGFGVAIPHGRIKSLRDVTAVFVRLREGITFDSPDDAPVRLALAILVPENATEQHLQLLSELAQMFSDENLRDELLAAREAEAAYALLTNWSPYADAHHSATV
jgi:nitrogen PTS system EIIA component